MCTLPSALKLLLGWYSACRRIALSS